MTTTGIETRNESELAVHDGGALIEERAVIVCLTLTGVGNRTKVDPRRVATNGNPNMLHFSKELYKSDELKAIGIADASIRKWVRARTLSALLKDGMYLVPLGALDEIDAKLQAFQAERAPLIEAFIDILPQRVEEAEADSQLGDLFDLSDYPGIEFNPEWDVGGPLYGLDPGLRRNANGELVKVLRYRITDDGAKLIKRAFGIRYRYVEVTAPGKLGGIKPELYRREREKAAADMGRLVANCRTVLRAEFQGLVDHMIARLSPSVDGKKKIFRNTLIPNFREACQLVKSREITDDAALQEILDKAEKLVGGIDSEYLRDFDVAREKVADGFTKLKTNVDKLVEDAPDRYIELED